MAMHKERSGARRSLGLPENCLPVDVVAACAQKYGGWYVDANGDAKRSAVNLESLLCSAQQQLKDALQQVVDAGCNIKMHKRDGEAAAVRLKATEEALRAAREEATRVAAAGVPGGGS